MGPGGAVRITLFFLSRGLRTIGAIVFLNKHIIFKIRWITKRNAVQMQFKNKRFK
jgi:hypothetical protein